MSIDCKNVKVIKGKKERSGLANLSVKPHLDYCHIVVGQPWNKSFYQKMESAQNGVA